MPACENRFPPPPPPPPGSAGCERLQELLPRGLGRTTSKPHASFLMRSTSVLSSRQSPRSWPSRLFSFLLFLPRAGDDSIQGTPSNRLDDGVVHRSSTNRPNWCSVEERETLLDPSIRAAVVTDEAAERPLLVLFLSGLWIANRNCFRALLHNYRRSPAQFFSDEIKKRTDRGTSSLTTTM